MRRLILISVVLALLVLAVAPAAAQPGATTYTVRPGDSLTALAQRYGITLEQLAAANNLTVTTRLIVGQQLVIPVAAPQPGALGTYRVQPGDTLSSIAVRFRTTVQNLVALNGIANINRVFVGQVLVVPTVPVQLPQPVPPTHPPQVGTFYHVRYGDTLLRIAARFGVSPWSIAELNGIYNLNRIYAGQVLRIR